MFCWPTELERGLGLRLGVRKHTEVRRFRFETKCFQVLQEIDVSGLCSSSHQHVDKMLYLLKSKLLIGCHSVEHLVSEQTGTAYITLVWYKGGCVQTAGWERRHQGPDLQRLRSLFWDASLIVLSTQQEVFNPFTAPHTGVNRVRPHSLSGVYLQKEFPLFLISLISTECKYEESDLQTHANKASAAAR